MQDNMRRDNMHRHTRTLTHTRTHAEQHGSHVVPTCDECVAEPAGQGFRVYGLVFRL